MGVEQREDMDTGRSLSGMEGEGRDSGAWGGWGGITWGEILDIGDGGMKAANHLVMCVPMHQSCMNYTYTPEPKLQ